MPQPSGRRRQPSGGEPAHLTEARSRLIAAIDIPDRASALEAVHRLSGHVGCFKLGLEVFLREGPDLVREVLGLGQRVFLDLKFHDIPNTVGGAVRSAAALGVHMLTVHAAGGRDMMAAARDAARAAARPPLLLGVTALTSLAAEDCRSIGVSLPVEEWTVRLAELA
ncbi:MAG: orotidine-5'-phosphate decarboxylase, partial [Acidobacteria bacterium]|nr:orotidine-5'-phosphate decarboxylase [Acidobacteriota bacterium]